MSSCNRMRLQRNLKHRVKPRTRQVPIGSSATNEQGTKSPRTLSDVVRKQLEDGQFHPYICQSSMVSGKLSYQNDFHSLKGTPSYINAATIWFERQQRLLPEVKTELASISQLSNTELIVKWKITWVRPAAVWLLRVGELFPHLKLEFKDILHKYGEESKVNAKGFQKLVTRAWKDGVLEIPTAAILGTSRFSFISKQEEGDLDDVQLFRVKESLDLVSKFDDDAVKNRTLTRDLLLFLLVRQPPGQSTEEWLAAVRQRIDVDKVPGMNVFSVDGQTSGERAQVYEDATAVLAYVTFSVLVVGVVFGYTYFQKLTRF